MEQALIMFKPGAEKKGYRDKSVLDLTNDYMLKHGFELLATRTKKLTKSEVLTMYPYLGKPDPFYSEALKAQVLEYLTSDNVTTYLFQGQAANRRLQRIKRVLRNRIGDPKTELGHKVENLVHVPDPHEVDLCMNLLIS